MASGGIEVQIHGAVPPATAAALSAHIAEAYARLAPAARPVLEVRLADTRERMAALAAADKARHGISTAGDEGFACAHDAFEDRPRITICVEALGEPRGPALSALRHEVGHAVLHGRRLFYQVRLDAALRGAGAHRGLGEQALLQLLFFVAVAVKDWAVSRLLLRHGLAEDVRALAWDLLTPSEEDRMAWGMAEPIESLRLLWAASQLKPLLNAAPLRALPEGAEVESRAREMLRYLPAPKSAALLELAWSIVPDLGDDTHVNIARATGSLLATGF
jgi:hypothetical protein